MNYKHSYTHLALKEGPKVQSDHIRRFLANGLPYVSFILQTSRTNIKRTKSTFKFVYPHLTLKEEPKVKSEIARTFPVNDLLEVGFT